MVKAQVSMEFLSVLAMSLVVILVIAVLAQQQINTLQQQKNAQDTQNSLLDLSSAAKSVYSQGEGSRQLVYVNLPSDYDPNGSVVGNNSITLKSAGTDYVALENFAVHGYLPQTSGMQWVWVVSEGDWVRIGEAMMEFDKNSIFLVMNSNSTASYSFSVTNVWTSGINISTTTTWANSDVSMSGVPASISLPANNSHAINLQFSSSSNSSGIYSGQIVFLAKDANNLTDNVDIPVTVEVVASGQQPYPTSDIQGPLIVDIYQAPTPAVLGQPLAIYVNATDSMTGNSTITGCQIDADNANNWHSMLPVDGAYNSPTELSVFNYTSGFDLGPHTVRAKCTDFYNNTGPTAYYYFNVSQADTLGPIVIQMTHPTNPTTLSNITLGGIATDVYTGDSNVSGCSVKVGNNGAWYPAAAFGSPWNTSATQNFTFNAGPFLVGNYNVYYQCMDSLGNIGGIYNDSFGVVDVDLMLAIDQSGSMVWTFTNASSASAVNAASTGWSNVENITVPVTSGNMANLTVAVKASTANCLVSYNATINGATVGTGNTTSTSYTTITSSINVASYQAPYVLTLWLKRNASGCTAYNDFLSVTQLPYKENAVEASADTFLNVSGNNIQAGLVTFSTTATTVQTLALMTPANQAALYASINGLPTPTGSTCLQCGLQNACAELVSSRSRPTANKVAVLLTDGVENVGNAIDGAEYCRANNVTVYTIGIGGDVNDTELTDIALLTYGNYYFAPNAATLTAIFDSIGRH